MKKISLLAACMLASAAAMAQADLVKEVTNSLKASKPDYAASLKAIQPALTNAETAETMMPWYLAGKSAFGVYEDAYLQENLGNQLTADQQKAAGHALLDGYNYYVKALHLDSLPDAKGKIKPKKSKEILNAISVAYPQFLNAGLYLYNNQDYKGAYDVWDVYVNLPQNPLLGKFAPTAAADSVVGQIAFYQGLSAMFFEDYAKAYKKMLDVIPSGFSNIYVYTYGAEAARRMGDNAAMLDLAKKGYEKYGTEDISLLGQIINSYLEKKDYAGARGLIDEGIQRTDPANANALSQLYNIRGVVFENSDDIPAAVADFEKAIQVNPNFAKGYYDLARMKFNKGVELANQSNDALTPEAKESFLAAVDLFKKAYELDDSMREAANNIYLAYYRLGADYVQEANLWKSISGQ